MDRLKCTSHGDAVALVLGGFPIGLGHEKLRQLRSGYATGDPWDVWGRES